MANLASQSSSTAALPPLSSLQSWVHHPQAVAKCNVSDVYALQALVSSVSVESREIFLLNQYPCKMVELVGWVAGVDDKEAFMTITLDDGDGSCVLPIKYRLPRRALSQPAQQSQPSPGKARVNHRSRAERQAAKETAAKAELERSFRGGPAQVYERKDIRVGDVVRVVGKVDEWARRKMTGTQWVRGVTVEEGAGGRIEVVDPDQQYLHAADVAKLHESTYCRPFTIPLLSVPPPRSTFSQIPPLPDRSSSQISDAFEGQSEMMSELWIGDDGALPDIRRLRSSQLHDNTFRRYLLDHMTEEVRLAALNADLAGPSEVERALHKLFPEYKITTKGKGRLPLTSAASPNIGTEAYTTPRNHRTKAERMALVQPQTPYPVFTISSLVNTPHLAELAGMIIDSIAKKAERHRRRRIRDGEATAKDKMVEDAANQSGGKVEWRITGGKKLRATERLVSWALGSISEEGSLVHVQSESAGSTDQRTPTASRPSTTPDTTAYTALPPPLVLPLLLRQLETERTIRSRVFVSRSDPRWGNGVTLQELLGKMRGWGEEGRWERLGEWRVEEGIQWGLIRGLIRREGQGFWAAERGQWVG